MNTTRRFARILLLGLVALTGACHFHGWGHGWGRGWGHGGGYHHHGGHHGHCR